MKIPRNAALLVCFCLASLACGASAPQQPPPKGWVLTWADDFDGANGSTPDAAKWVLETGGNGWGNNELEYYTTRLQNSARKDGNLVITVLKEPFTGSDGVSRDYTSARLKTATRFTPAYGRFEARIKVPKGQGIWPAFWMLGDNIDVVGWPTCGEIDIMENIGSEPGKVHGSMHGPGYSGNTPLTAIYSLQSGTFTDDFHVFAVEWEPAAVRFYVDGNLYLKEQPANLQCEYAMGVRPSVLHVVERRCGRELSWQSRRIQHLSADHACRLGTGVCAQLGAYRPHAFLKQGL